MKNDVIIIGEGPGGYVAAIHAARLGAKVCLIEKKKLGGTYLNRGCIPTKALYKNAEILSALKRVDELGINVNDYTINIEQIHKRKQKIIDELVNGISELLKANNVQIVYGEAKFKDKNTILVITEDNSECEVTGKNIVIATGSIPTIPLIEGANFDGIYTSEDSIIPSCIFIFPEAACVGVTEDEAKATGLNYKTSKFMFGSKGKALTLGEGEGFIKLISTNNLTEDKNDNVLIGAHIMGPHASDLIHECTLAISKKLKIGDIKNVIHAHPTLSETFIEAVNGLVGEAIHMVPPKNN